MSFFTDNWKRIRGSIQEAVTGESLKAQVFRGGAWMGAGTFSEQVVRFGRNMLLTRILAPEAFGTMAIVASAGTILHTLTDIGVKESIIQNPRGAEDRYISGAWWLALGRSSFLYAMVFLFAPWIAAFYGNHEIAPLLRVAAFTVVLDGALSSKAYIAVKQMRFARWAAFQNGGGIIGVLITIGLSFYIRDVWALVLGTVSESLIRCIMSYLLFPFLPSFSLDMHAIRDLLKFSKGLFGLAFLNLIFARTDVFVLAKLFSPAALGLYVIAINLVQTPAGFIMTLLGQTLLPTFSKVQDNPARENRILLRVSSVLVLVGMPVFAFMAFCSHSLLTLFYGARYGAATTALILASGVALLNILNGQITTVFYARGLPQLHRRAVAATAVTMVALIWPCAKWLGPAGGQLAALASISVGFLFQIDRIRHITGFNLAQYAKAFTLAAGISICVACVYFGARAFGVLDGPMPNILLGAVGCLLAYGLAAWILTRRSAVASPSRS
jgi:O-antigen/teichoic acid export membrane protein